MVQQVNSCSASLCKGSFTHYLYTDTVDQLYALYYNYMLGSKSRAWTMVFCTICVQGQYMTHRLTRAEVWVVHAAAGLMLWPDYAATAQTTYSKTDTYSNVASIHHSLPPQERIVFLEILSSAWFHTPEELN